MFIVSSTYRLNPRPTIILEVVLFDTHSDPFHSSTVHWRKYFDVWTLVMLVLLTILYRIYKGIWSFLEFAKGSSVCILTWTLHSDSLLSGVGIDSNSSVIEAWCSYVDVMGRQWCFIHIQTRHVATWSYCPLKCKGFIYTSYLYHTLSTYNRCRLWALDYQTRIMSTSHRTNNDNAEYKLITSYVSWSSCIGMAKRPHYTFTLRNL